jgi:hypothetical protein
LTLKPAWLLLLQVAIEGLPTAEHWPVAADLKKLLSARIGRPFTTQEIEDDVRTLLSTGGALLSTALCSQRAVMCPHACGLEQMLA